MKLDARIADDLQKSRDLGLKSGEILALDVLDQCYRTFRQHFGPEILSGLDGETLLETMHAHGRKDSLVYWLEFKGDGELPARFGSIAGGSALKFGIYRSSETGQWMTGPPQAQQAITKNQAVAIARRHRDQLIRGCELLALLPEDADGAAYDQLQQDMEHEVPDVSNTAWGHKYFHMIHPEKLDDFHSLEYQSFNLIKMLQVPPNGRYRAAASYKAIARELNWPLNHLTSTLYRRNGAPYHYWRIGTKLEGTDSIWELMRANNFIAVGWSQFHDLSSLEHTRQSKEELRSLMEKQYPNTPQAIGNQTQQLFNFVTAISQGEIAVAMDGTKVLGIGRIIGDYYYESSACPHRRPVEWLALDEWSFSQPEGLRTTVHQIKKYNGNLIAIEEHILAGLTATLPLPQLQPQPRHLTGLLGNIEHILARKKQVILYGPPGTGKTYWAEQAARELSIRRNDGLGDKSDSGLVRLCAFHPNYGYEDFIEGYRPVDHNGQLTFELRDGIFKQMCHAAEDHPNRHYYLIIDEINRGDIPRIFGELLTLLEADKRGKVLYLPLSGSPFHVPENLYVIGTMNTADRSVALLDTALRRRFGFIELLPNPEALDDIVLEGVPLRAWLKTLNRRIVENFGQEGRNLRIGHAYLMPSGRTVATFGQFASILREEIIPLLEEYCYEDFSLLERILGEKLIDGVQLRIREELFSVNAPAELASALLAASPELAASEIAVEGEAEAADVTGDHEDEMPDDNENTEV